MFNSIKELKKLSFMEIYFRIVSLLFWPIYWYKWIVITIENYNLVLFEVYLVVDSIFILLLLIRKIFKKVTQSNLYFLFALSMSVNYLVSLYSFMICPTNIPVLYLKMFTCILMMIISWKLIKKEDNDIGVVGLMAGILILMLTYFY